MFSHRQILPLLPRQFFVFFLKAPDVAYTPTGPSKVHCTSARLFSKPICFCLPSPITQQIVDVSTGPLFLLDYFCYFMKTHCC